MEKVSTTVDALASVVQGHTNREDWPRLATHCRKSVKSLQCVSENDLIRYFQAMDPHEHTVGMACMLALACKGGSVRGGDVTYNHITQWLSSCSGAQLRLVPLEAGCVARAYAAHAMGSPELAAAALLPLHHALRAMQPSTDYMTPFHAAFLQVAIRSKRYSVAKSLLNEELYHLTGTGLTITDYLLYGYYGGLCALAYKDYAAAYRLFELALTVPTSVGDAIVLAAWRRYQLAYAIDTGRSVTIPRHAATATKRELKDNDVVTTAVKLFANNKFSAFDDLIDKESAKFKEYGLWGMVKQLQEKAVTHRIKRLTTTYLTLPLSGIAAQAGLAGPEQAAAHLLKMIDAGEVSARINEGAGMVELHGQHPEETLDLLPKLHCRLEKIQALQRRLNIAIKDCQLETRYVQTLVRDGPKSSPMYIDPDEGLAT